MADRRAQDWTPPGVFRALLWWPPVAFLLAAAFPGAGLVPIIGSGLALALVGIAAATLPKLVHRSESVTAAEPIDRPAPEPVDVLPVPERRAA
ncbi:MULTISPECIES: hypothetical protein [Pseudonocardia]|jgi:hypothetical protein|uniref:hypothetical protein n=1 Tax=Pseudonocardia TaxID=1847 RepID=UPI001046BDD4|nr:hypothetical protein [Pseudonocardia dioxanivorans]GJF01714.1 hypothetical protein PSD17_06780 [Pseudonocardia sp. D17]